MKINHHSKKYFLGFWHSLVLVLLVSCHSDKITTADPNGQISGAILDSAYHGLSNVLVSTSPPTNQILSDSSGHFSFSDVHAGDYIVSAVKSGYAKGTAEVLVQAGKTTTATIILQTIDTTGTIKGKVLDSIGDPIANATITTVPATIEITTKNDGNFLIAGISPGIYNVTATNSGKTASANVTVEAGKTSTITINFKSSNSDNLHIDGLVTFYSLDGDGIDNSGNGLNLSIQNATFGTSRKGITNSALIFGNTGPAAIGVSDSKLILSSLTISFWMKIPYPQVSGNQGMVFLSKYVISSNNGYLFYCIGSSFLWLYGFGSGSTFSQFDSYPRDNAWHHIVGTADNTGTNMFIDGVKVSSGSWNTSPGTTSQAAPFAIGRADNAINPTGMMDDIRIYNRVLTNSEINILANDK